MSPSTRMLAHVVRTPGAQSTIAAYMVPATSAALVIVSQKRRGFVLAQRAYFAALEAHKAAFRDKASGKEIGLAWLHVGETKTALDFASRGLSDALQAVGVKRVEIW
jgi:hypothetical protein